MGNRPSSGAEGSHVAVILQSPRTEDEAKIAGGYMPCTHKLHLDSHSQSVIPTSRGILHLMHDKLLQLLEGYEMMGTGYQ